MPDYSLIDTKDVKRAIEASDLGSFNSCPLLQIAKTIDGLTKILLVQLKITEAIRGMEFLIDV